jgi:antitoxin VapB
VQLPPLNASRIGTRQTSFYFVPCGICFLLRPPIHTQVSWSELLWYMPLIYTLPRIMAKTKVAKLFRNGRSQAVRLPKEFRFEGDCVRVRKVAGGVLLEPIISDAAKWLAELRRLNIEPLLPKGRKQPRAPRRRIFA